MEETKVNLIKTKESLSNIKIHDSRVTDLDNQNKSVDKKIIEFHIEDNQFRGEKYKKDIRFYKESIESEEIKIIKLSNIYIPDNIETLLVIDVQGFELEVIESINFNNAPKYIFYEDDLKDNPKAEKIKSILKKNNYKYIGGDHDLIYKKM